MDQLKRTDDAMEHVVGCLDIQSQTALAGTSRRYQAFVEKVQLNRIRRDYRELFEFTNLTAEDVSKAFTLSTIPLSEIYPFNSVKSGDHTPPSMMRVFWDFSRDHVLWRGPVVTRAGEVSGSYLAFKVNQYQNVSRGSRPDVVMVNGDSMVRLPRLWRDTNLVFIFNDGGFTIGWALGDILYPVAWSTGVRGKEVSLQQHKETFSKIESLFHNELVQIRENIHMIKVDAALKEDAALEADAELKTACSCPCAVM